MTHNRATAPSAMNVHHKAGVLNWTARIVGLAALAGGPLSALAAEVAVEESPMWLFHNFALATAFCLAFFLICPGVLLSMAGAIAHRRHLLGDMLLVVSSILVICYFYAYPFPIDWGWIGEPRHVLPVCVVFLLGGILHLIVWWKEDGGKTT